MSDAELGGQEDLFTKEKVRAKKDAKGENFFFLIFGQIVVVGVVFEPRQCVIFVDRQHTANTINLIHKFGRCACGHSYGLGSSLHAKLVKTYDRCHFFLEFVFQ